MLRRFCLLIVLFLTAGCSRDKTESTPAPPRPERLPAEVELSPEEALKRYYRGRPLPAPFTRRNP